MTYTPINKKKPQKILVIPEKALPLQSNCAKEGR